MASSLIEGVSPSEFCETKTETVGPSVDWQGSMCVWVSNERFLPFCQTTKPKGQFSEDVSNFLKHHKGLADFVREATKKLVEFLGKDGELTYWIHKDPESGDSKLLVEILATDPYEANRQLTNFCYEWWFDRIGEVGHLIGFRIAASS